MRTEHGIGWHRDGGWCRIFPGDGKRTYFGKVSAADAVRAAVKEEDRRERERAGEVVAERALTNAIVRDAVNLFLAHADRQHAAGTMSAAQRASYGDELARFVEAVGKTTPLADLCKLTAPERVFRPLREVAVRRGLAAAAKHVVQVRTFLDWCSRVRRLMPAPFYADEFSPPGAAEKRASVKAERRAKGTASWEPSEVREIIEAARQTDVHRYAWVLLMVNGGMGATDLSNLEDADVDWDRRCIHTDRSKTLVPRVVPLWDVTVDAMRASRAARAAPARPEWAGRFFLTRKGVPLVTTGLSADGRRTTGTDAVRNWMFGILNPGKASDSGKGRKPLPSVPGLKRHRAGAYTLRSVFATLAAGQNATLVAVVMGHKLPRDIMQHYLRGDMLAKLSGVTEHVRIQLWP